MVGAGVVESDAAQSELDFECDSALAALFRGEDGPVVGEHAGRDAPAGERGGEGVDDLRAEGDPSGFGGDVGPGVVVENVQDLHIGAVGEMPVGGVGLPAFVGLVGAEPVPGGSGSFLGLRGDEPAPGEDPPDRGDRRHRRDPGRGEVGGDGLAAGVEALLGQGLAEPDDLVLQLQADRVR